MAPALGRALQRLVLRTQGGLLRPLWRLGHAVVIRAVVRWVGGPSASGYVRGSFGYGDVIYGLSDVDLSVVVAGSAGDQGRAAERARARWRLLCRLAPTLRHLVQMAVYDERELAQVAGAPTLTSRHAVHLPPHPLRDEAFLRFRPGLFGPLCDWRLVHGAGSLPRRGVQDAHQGRTAAWLELQRWWREAFFTCAHPGRADLPYVCVKLVAEPARILLWHVHGERLTGRRQVLERALRRLPDHQPGLECALAVHRELARSPDASLADALASCLRLSDQLARRFTEEVAGAGTTSVALTWGDESELVLPARGHQQLAALGSGVPRLLPLADWKARVWPVFADDALAPVALDPARPERLGAAARAAGDYGPYAAVRWHDLLVLPGPGLMRAVQCAATDPVSFALLEGRDRAAFPDVPGWSARDGALRALVEHRAWLGAHRGGGGPAMAEWMEAQARTTLPAGETIGRLLTAAQAALFLDSLDRGEPELALTMAAVARRLGAAGASARTLADEAWGRYRDWRLDGAPVPPRVVLALREQVLGLPGYSFDTPWPTAVGARRRRPARAPVGQSAR